MALQLHRNLPTKTSVYHTTVVVVISPCSPLCFQACTYPSAWCLRLSVNIANSVQLTYYHFAFQIVFARLVTSWEILDEDIWILVDMYDTAFYFITSYIYTPIYTYISIVFYSKSASLVRSNPFGYKEEILRCISSVCSHQWY